MLTYRKDFEKYPTPCYFYDIELLRKTLDRASSSAQKHNYHVHYAFKANTTPRLLEEIQKAGFGADCVSGNEVLAAIHSGFQSKDIVFAGVGKSDQEIIDGLQHDIFCFNVESMAEIEVINELAAQRHQKARIALRINPNVDAHTHHYITTGLDENKFGLNMHEMDEVVQLLKNFQHIELIGLHFHIGSQITDLSVFVSLCTRVNEIQDWFRHHGIYLKHINMGGGLGIDYTMPDEHAIPDFESFFQVFNTHLELQPHQEVHFELGRALVGNCGSLLSKVLYIKSGMKKKFAILDAGMTELIRPALYQAYHKIENLSSQEALEKYDVVGPICESSDCFGKEVALNKTTRGDLIAIRSTGAYGEVLSSNYNLRDKAPSFYSDEN